jgi:hypothetical protein
LGESLAEILREGTRREEERRRDRLSRLRGMAVGAGLAALAPLAARAASGRVKRRLAKAAVKHAAKGPARAVRNMASRG